MSGNPVGGAVATNLGLRTNLSFLRYVLLPFGCGVRRKFRLAPVPEDQQLEAVKSTFKEPEKLKDALEDAFERTMQSLVVGLKSPWLLMETGETDFTEAFTRLVVTPFSEQEGLTGRLRLDFLDGFFLDYDTVVENIPAIIGIDELDDERFLALLLSYDRVENVDDLAEAAWQELSYALTTVGGLEDEHPVLRLGNFERVLLDGILAHVYEIALEEPAWASLVAFLSNERIDRDRMRAVATGDSRLQQRLIQEQLLVDRIERYRTLGGAILPNRDWLFDIADRLEDTVDSIESEISGETIEVSAVLRLVGSTVEEVHKRQATSNIVNAAAPLERPSRRALKLVRKARHDFCFADWRAEGYGETCLSLGAALWPIAGPRLAERYFREAVAFDPESPIGHYDLFLSELQQEHYGRALDHLLRAIARRPEDFEPFDLRRFQIERILGAGGTGVTYEVRSWDDRHMVIKTLWDELTVADPRPTLRSLQQFIKDPIPGAEPVYYLLAHRKARTCIVSGYIEGEDLETFREARGGRIPPGQAMEIAWRGATVLVAAHERRLIHRNLKPENIRVGAQPDGLAVTLVDFAVPNFVINVPDRILGVRRFACWSRLGRKVSEHLAGFAAPELLRNGSDAASPQSDIYSLGATIYYLMTGFTARDFRRELLPEPVQNLIARCLNKDPDERPENIQILRQEFQRLAQVLDGESAAPSATPSALESESEIELIPEIEDELPDISELDELSDLAAAPGPRGPASFPMDPLAASPAPLEFGTSETVRLPPGTSAPMAFPGAEVSDLKGASPDDTVPMGPAAVGGLRLTGGDDVPADDPFGLAGPPAPSPFPSAAELDPVGGPDPFGLAGDVGGPPGASAPFDIASDITAGPLVPGARAPGEAFGAGDPFGASSVAGGGGDPFGLLSGIDARDSAPGGLAPSQASPGSPDFGAPPGPSGDPFDSGAGGDPFGLASGIDELAAPGGRTPGDPFGLADPLAGVPGAGPPGGATAPFASGVQNDPFGASTGGDPFGLMSGVDAMGPPAAGLPGPGAPPGLPGDPFDSGSGGDPFGLSSGIQDPAFGAPAGFPAAPGGDPFGASGVQPGGPGGQDPFGLMSGVDAASGRPGAPAQGRGDDPFGMSSIVENKPLGLQGGGDPFGMSGSQDNLMPPAGAGPFPGLQLGDSGSGLLESRSSRFDESQDEQPLDPMEALKILEAMTGGPVKEPPKKKRKATRNPFDADPNLLSFDDPAPGMADFALTPARGLRIPDSGAISKLNLEAPSNLDLDELALPPDLDVPGAASGLTSPSSMGLAPPANLDLDELKVPEAEKKRERKKKKSKRRRSRESRRRATAGGPDRDYGLVISGLGLKSKKEAAIKIIMEIRSVSEEEARDLCRSPVVPVLKRVSKDEAEKAMARFKKAKINCRVNKRRGRR